MTEKSSVYQKLFSELIEAFTSGEIDKKGYEECLAELGKAEKDFQASLTRPIKSQTYKELLAELDELYEKKEVNKDEHVRGLKMLEATEALFSTIFPDNKIPDQVHDFLKEKFPLKKEAVCIPTKAEVYIAKNLPQHVGEVLNKRLVQADKDAADLEASKKEVIKLEEANQILIEKALNKRLVQADKDAADLEAFKKEVIKLEEANQILIEKVSDQGVIKKIQKETEQLKEDLEKRERNLRITMLTLEVDEANKRADIAREFTFAVFKNPTFKTMEQHVGTTPVKITYKDYSGNITETHLD